MTSRGFRPDGAAPAQGQDRHSRTSNPAAGTPPGFSYYTDLPPERFRDRPLGKAAWRLFRLASSLQLAVVLLSLFTLCLAVATFLESAFDGTIARQLIYRAWWFSFLLGLLAVNVLCAALKKFPWKRHQIGFLITHAGLLVLIFGGLLTNLGGVDGQMTMIDSSNRELQGMFRLPDRSDTVQLTGEHQVEIYRVPRSAAEKDQALMQELLRVVEGGLEPSDVLKKKLQGQHWAVNLCPGNFAWKSDEHFQPKLPWMVALLKRLADPFPGFTRRLVDDLCLTVENFYPHTESWPFSPAANEAEGFPALLLHLSTPMTPRPMKRWITSLPDLEPDPNPVGFEMLSLNDSALLNEFLHPPEPSSLGTLGQLVLVMGPRSAVCRVDLDRVKVDTPVDLELKGWKFTLKKTGHLMDLLGEQEKADDKPAMPSYRPAYPAVLFELTAPTGHQGTYAACARLPHMPAHRSGVDFGRVSAWYHWPDFRWGEKHKLGAMQFLRSPDGRLYLRVYGKDGLKAQGQELDPTDTTTAHQLPWAPMNMTFQIGGWIPSATRKDKVIPRHVRPGSEPSERLEPALRCTLATSDKTQEFWVRMSRHATQVNVGDNLYFVRYRQASKRLDFALRLKKATQVSDPGTNRPAAYQSEVTLIAEKDGRKVESDHVISMNSTLDHGKYKVYQTNYRPMTDPQTFEVMVDRDGRMVSLSGFTVAHDPGLYWKYAGSLLLVAGIATMFWMRAYFFKRPSKSQPTTN